MNKRNRLVIVFLLLLGIFLILFSMAIAVSWAYSIYDNVSINTTINDINNANDITESLVGPLVTTTLIDIIKGTIDVTNSNSTNLSFTTIYDIKVAMGAYWFFAIFSLIGIIIVSCILSKSHKYQSLIGTIDRMVAKRNRLITVFLLFFMVFLVFFSMAIATSWAYNIYDNASNGSTTISDFNNAKDIIKALVNPFLTSTLDNIRFAMGAYWFFTIFSLICMAIIGYFLSNSRIYQSLIRTIDKKITKKNRSIITFLLFLVMFLIFFSMAITTSWAYNIYNNLSINSTINDINNADDIMKALVKPLLTPTLNSIRFAMGAYWFFTIFSLIGMIIVRYRFSKPWIYQIQRMRSRRQVEYNDARTLRRSLTASRKTKRSPRKQIRR